MKMKEFFSKFLFHIKRRIPAIVACILAFCTLGLYYLGLFEVSFIKRPEAWKDNSENFYNALNVLFGKEEQKEEEKLPQDTTSAPDTEKKETEPSETKEPFDPNGGDGEDDTPQSSLITEFTVMPTVSQLAAEGYKRTDAVFSAGDKLALLETTYHLPKKFSFSKKTYDKEIAVHYDDGKEAEVKTETVTEDRPAIELYMGYIIYDDGGSKRYLIGPDGTALTLFDDTKYYPAYTRDKEGRPLFYQTYEYTVEYPTELGEEDEEGNAPWLKTEKLKLKGKKYFYLSDNGRKFEESDYNDATDNRGLYFDYPAYYGVPTKEDTKEELTRFYKETTKVLTKLDKKNKKVTAVFPEVEWLFYEKDDKEFDPDAEDVVYPYTTAYNYSEGYAVVGSDVIWEHTDLEDKEKVTEYRDRELYVIDEKGKIMFTSRKNFTSDLGWNANEFYCDPLLRDISSIGSYYFDHGLLRIRLQSYDRYQFTEYDMFMIGTDDDLLVRPDGSRFYIPSGYKLEVYSDGMLLLSRDGKYGYMNYKGEWVVEMGLLNASPFVEGVAAVQRPNGKYGMIDTEGNTVIPFRYDHISNASSGLVAAFSEKNGWEIYAKMTK